MKIIDAHAHIFPPKLVVTATKATQDFYELPSMRHEGSAEALLASGKNAGVTNYMVFSTATTSAQVPNINDFIIAECAAHKEFIGAGTMHRDFADFENELDRLRASGILGIKLHPDFQRFNFDDAALLPVFAALQDRGMFVITHSGDHRYDYSHPTRIARVAKMFPEMRIIAAHLGGWMKWDIARRELVLPNVWVDCASTFGFTGPETFFAALDAFGGKRIIFGCDFPMWDHEEELDHLRALGLPERQLEDILYNNFMEFYGAAGSL